MAVAPQRASYRIDKDNIYVGDDVRMATKVLLRPNKIHMRLPGIIIYDCSWDDGAKYYFHIPDDTCKKAGKSRYFTIKNSLRGPRE